MSRRPPISRRASRRALPLAAGLAIYLLAGVGAASAAGPGPSMEPMDARGGVHAHGGAQAGAAAASPNLVWHGGQILTDTVVQSIFWGRTWNSPGDKISGLDTFYGGVGGSPYMNTNTEYTGTNGQVGNGVAFAGHVVDTSAAPKRAPSTTTILAEVAKRIANPVANGYYPVYTDLPRGNNGYCAWHSYGTVRGVPVQFGFFFRLDGDAGCDPGDPGTVHSQGLEALANVSGHELSETVSDPRNGGWWDNSGAENSDKCAWTFSGLVTIGGEAWKIQGNWSNAAYNAGSGYYAKGCIQTK